MRIFSHLISLEEGFELGCVPPSVSSFELGCHPCIVLVDCWMVIDYIWYFSPLQKLKVCIHQLIVSCLVFFFFFKFWTCTILCDLATDGISVARVLDDESSAGARFWSYWFVIAFRHGKIKSNRSIPTEKEIIGYDTWTFFYVSVVYVFLIYFPYQLRKFLLIHILFEKEQERMEAIAPKKQRASNGIENTQL